MFAKLIKWDSIPWKEEFKFSLDIALTEVFALISLSSVQNCENWFAVVFSWELSSKLKNVLSEFAWFLHLHSHLHHIKQTRRNLFCFVFSSDWTVYIRIGNINASFCCVATQLVHINVSKVSNCNIVECPAEGVEKVATYLSCSKCNSSLPRNQQENIIKCTNCGMAKLKSRCKTRALAKVVFIKPHWAGEVTLTIFDDKLSLLHGIYKTQSGDDRDFTQLSEDDLTVMLFNCQR